MMRKLLRKKILVLILISFGLIVGLANSIATPVNANLLIYNRVDLKFDENLSDQRERAYAEPQKILVHQVRTNVDSLTYDSERWVQSLYYYSITRLGFADIPYNYLIDRQGKVYKGRAGYEGIVPELENKEGAILIGYLSNGADITMLAQDTLNQLITKQSKQFGIDNDSLEVVNLKKIGGVNNQEVENIQFAKLEYMTLSNSFSSNLRKSLEKVNWSSEKILTDYKGEIIEVDYPKKVGIGEQFDVKIRFKNNNDFVWFTNNEYIYISTVDGEDSPFYLNETWDSESKPYSISNDAVLPGENKSITFKMGVNYEPGEKEESFVFWASPEGNTVIEDTQFDVKVQVQTGDTRLIEITDTGVDWINVRECPGRGCEKIGQLEVGGYAEVIEEEGSWFKIRYGDEKEGWIVNSYYKSVE